MDASRDFGAHRLTFCLDFSTSIGAALAIRRRPHRVTFKQGEKESSKPLVPNADPTKQIPDVEKAPKPILTTKDEPGWRVGVTALGKLGLIMAYFYLCDR